MAKQSDVYFLMMKQWDVNFQLLTMEQRGILITAIYDYQCRGIDFQTDDGMLQMVWATFKQIFAYNNKKYEKRCEINRKNAKKRWGNQTNACRRMQTDAFDADNDIDIDNDNENDIDIDIEADNDLYTAALKKAEKNFRFLIHHDYANMMDGYDLSHRHIRSGELCALYDLVEEAPLEQYLIKSHAYAKSPAPARMILRWAAMDGTLKTVLGYGKH